MMLLWLSSIDQGLLLDPVPETVDRFMVTHLPSFDGLDRCGPNTEIPCGIGHCQSKLNALELQVLGGRR